MASSSIFQPESVLVSVASPVAPGTTSVGARAAWNCSPDVSEPRDADPDCDGQHGRRAGADQGEAALHRHATRALRRLDASPQGRRGLDLGCGGPRQVDSPLLLGEPVGELRRRSDSCLEGGATLRCERSVRERREFDDLLIGVVVLASASHGHGDTHGNAPLRMRGESTEMAQELVTSGRTPSGPSYSPAGVVSSRTRSAPGSRRRRSPSCGG